MKYAQHFLLALLVSGLMVIPGVAQTSSNSNQQSEGQANQSLQQGSVGQNGRNMTDRQFIKKAAQDDMAEVQMAQLAEQKATNDNVKQFAQKLMNDHQNNEQKLKQVAQQQGVNLPSQLTQKQQAKYDRLSKLNGTQFDKAFIRQQVKAHKKAIANFQHASANASHQDVKQYASNTVPTLEQHLQMAKDCAQQLGVNTSAGMNQHGKETSARNNQQQMK